MARLPVPGSDENTWGNVLNDFLGQAHNADGSIKDSAITGLAGQSVSGTAPADNDVLTYNSATSQWEPAAPGAASVPDATAGTKGILQLTGDLGGTAASPTVPGLANKADISALTTHEADTTNVHGIADTSVLETTSGAQAKVDTHSSDTTGVHGIADTSALETTTGAQAKVDAHVNDTADAHDASAISFAPTGTIAATDVQAALAEASGDMTTHAALSSRSAHGVVEQRWRTSGTTGWTERVINTDSTQTFTYSVAGDRLRCTSNSASGGAYRTFLLHNTFVAADSEISSTWWGPNTFTHPTDIPQMGHVHRAQISGGTTIAAVVWHDVAFGAPWVMNTNTMYGDGTTLTQGTETTVGATTAYNRQSNTSRSTRIVRAQRASNVVTCYVARSNPLRTWVVGDTVTITGMADSSFNATGVAITAVDAANSSFTFAQTAANATDADAGGLVAQTLGHKTVFPYSMKSRLIGNLLQFKQWAYGDPEPDWGDTLHVGQATLGQGSMPIPPPTGPGQCGVFFGHGLSGNYREFGNVTITQL